MRLRRLMVMLAMAAWAGSAEAAEPAALAKARALYNAATYDAAIEAAAAARSDPAFADAAALVMARSYLERFRINGDPADLTAGRETLGTIRASALSPRDQLDLLIGLGQALYLGDSFGAAAEIFDTALTKASLLGVPDRLRLLDWWATAVDREAQTRVPDRRGPLFDRISERMEGELRADPGNAAANYWLMVATRGQGDLDRAWDIATAAWVRAALLPATTERLRTDIDRFVNQILIPERARMRPPREQPDATVALRGEWDALKQQWK